MKDRLKRTVERFAPQCDYFEVHLEETEETRVQFQGKKLADLGSTIDFGGNVRALVKGGWGFASFNSLDRIDEFAENAVAQAKMVGRETSVLAEVEPVVAEVKLDLESSPGDVPLEDKVSIMRAYNDRALAHDERIVNTMTRYFDRFRKFWFLSSEGADIYQERMDLGGMVGPIAVKDGDTIVATDMSLMWIERSLFVDPMVDDTFHKGPPGVQNLRMALLDFPESNLLLDDYEFKIDQLMHALTWPVTTWNSTPPPLRPALDTRDFPFRNEWTQATCGILFRHAAHGYRRNHLPYSAGGVSVDDHNKETQYLQASELVLSEYKDFVRYKKLEINTSLCTGSVNSIYGGLFR